MGYLLRLYYLLIVVLLPLGSQARSVSVDLAPDDGLFTALSIATEVAQARVPHITVVQENELREPREETQEEEEEEELTDTCSALAFPYPLIDSRPEWNAFLFHPCGPLLFKRYLYFQALKLDC